MSDQLQSLGIMCFRFRINEEILYEAPDMYTTTQMEMGAFRCMEFTELAYDTSEELKVSMLGYYHLQDLRA